MDNPNQQNPTKRRHGLQGDDLIHQLRGGWAPLPTRTVFDLVLAGLRVRLTRSLVTMLAVVLAIAFLTYTGLNNRLTHNLASHATSEMEIPSMEPAQVNQAIATLARHDPTKALKPGEWDWLRLFVTESPRQIEEQIEEARETFAVVPPERLQELNTRLQLARALAGQSDAAPAQIDSLAGEFYRREAARILPTFRNPSLWDEGRRARALHVLSSYEELSQADGTERATALLRESISIEDRKTKGTELARVLRRAGVNIEATLAGGFADTWVIVMALLLCTVGIANAMLMSVTERFREIGTMKCLGAQDGLVVKLFLLESAFLGVFGAFLGILLGIVVGLTAGLLQFRGATFLGFPTVDGLPVLGWSILTGILLAVVGTLYPAVLAARMKPVDALRIDE